MGNNEKLINSIKQLIKQNGNQEITGTILQNVLVSIISNLGSNYEFVGIANPTSTPGTPDQNVFYIAGVEGTYINFNNIILRFGEIALLTWKGSWIKMGLPIYSTEYIKTKILQEKTNPNSLICWSTLPSMTQITNGVQGIYEYNQPITDMPKFTGEGFMSYTYKFISPTPGNYLPLNIYCNNIRGANSIYRSVLIVDENNNPIYAANIIGSQCYKLYHNQTIQVTVDQTKGSVYYEAQSNHVTINSMFEKQLYVPNTKVGIMNSEIVSNAQNYTTINLSSFQLDSVLTTGTKEHYSSIINGNNLTIGQCIPETSGGNTNIWGFNFIHDNIKKDTIIYMTFTIYCPIAGSNLYPEIVSNMATILETNLNYMYEGWNTKYLVIQLNRDITVADMLFVSYNRNKLNNKYFFANRSFFISVANWAISGLNYLDINLFNMLNRIKALETGGFANSQVICLGDSLTAGAGGNSTYQKSTVLSKYIELGIPTSSLQGDITYPIAMRAILGNTYTVNNLGVGGENIRTIAARQGAAPALLSMDITIPSNTDTIIVATPTNYLKSSFDGQPVTPLLQSSPTLVNPCIIEGVECTLSYTNPNYSIKRNVAGTAMNIKADSQIIMISAKNNRNPQLAVIWCWQNGGYSNEEDLIIKLDKIISNIGTTNFLLIGLHSGTLESRKEQENALTAKYGDRFFNWRNYVSTNALAEFGITPTKDSDLTPEQIANGAKSDIYQMSVGALPSSLWSKMFGRNGDTSNDVVHLNAAGYLILGYKIVQRFKDIGAVK